MRSPEASVSALLPVHGGVNAAHLRESVMSLIGQTRVPDELVIVEDGPLTRAHLACLQEVSERHSHVTRVALSENRGAGVANQIGLEAASGTWIAKADADDINVDRRIEVQLSTVTSQNVDLCGSAMMEFEGDLNNIVSIRSAPLTHHAIGKRLRFNNPINHPTAFYKRDLALTVGGYPPWRHMQDYGLMARMYAGGAQMMNIDDALVLFRADAGVITRRRSATIRRLEWVLQHELHRLGLVSTLRAGLNLVWRVAFRSLPPSVVGMASRRVLAREPNK